MIELTSEQITALYHPYYSHGFKQDEISIERYFIEPNKKIIATLHIHQLAFDGGREEEPYLSGLLATRCFHQIGMIYLAHHYGKNKIKFIPRGFYINFKKYLKNRSFVVIFDINSHESVSGKIRLNVIADFDNGKIIASATLFGLPITQ